MAKLRLVVWMLATGLLAVVLLRDLGWSEDPAVATMIVIQCVAGVLAAYLCLATVLAVRMPRVAPRFVRRLVAGAVGAGLLAAPLTASAEPRPRPPAEVPVLRRIPGDPSSRAASRPDVAPAGRQNAAEVVVAPGDHLWSISERALGERLGRPPTDAEIVPFWLELIDTNRDRLLDPGNPDLIMPEQRFRLPS